MKGCATLYPIASHNSTPCANGFIVYDCGATVKYIISGGKLSLLEITVPIGYAEFMDTIKESELVENLKKGIPPNG